MCCSYSAEGHGPEQRKQIHPFRQWEVLGRKQWARGTEGDGERRLHPVEQSRMASLGR